MLEPILIAAGIGFGNPHPDKAARHSAHQARGAGAGDGR